MLSANWLTEAGEDAETELQMVKQAEQNEQNSV